MKKFVAALLFVVGLAFAANLMADDTKKEPTTKPTTTSAPVKASVKA